MMASKAKKELVWATAETFGYNYSIIVVPFHHCFTSISARFTIISPYTIILQRFLVGFKKGPAIYHTREATGQVQKQGAQTILVFALLATVCCIAFLCVFLLVWGGWLWKF
jgi:hypothetical protein